MVLKDWKKNMLWKMSYYSPFDCFGDGSPWIEKLTRNYKQQAHIIEKYTRQICDPIWEEQHYEIEKQSKKYLICPSVFMASSSPLMGIKTRNYMRQIHIEMN